MTSEDMVVKFNDLIVKMKNIMIVYVFLSNDAIKCTFHPNYNHMGV